MQLTAHALPEPELDGAGRDRPKPPGVTEYDARRCVACGCNYPAYGFGPPLHASTTIWTCASHRLEVLRQVRASGTFHVDRVGRAVDDDRPDLGGRTARIAQRSFLYAQNACFNGYDIDTMKTLCVDASLPIIDTRRTGGGPEIQLRYPPPMIAVGRIPDPYPWYRRSYAPLFYVAALYHAAGAEVLNLEPKPSTPPG